MTVLIIIGIILLILLLLLCFPVAVQVSANTGQATVKAHYLFLAFTLFPRPPKKQKATPEPAKKEKTEETAPEKKKGKKKSRISLHMIRELFHGAKGALRILCRHLVFSHIDVAVRVGGEDAHQIAMRYSQFSQIATITFSIIDALFVLRKPQVVILPDFVAPDTQYVLTLRVSIRPIFAIAAALYFVTAYLRLQTRRKSAKPARQPSV